MLIDNSCCCYTHVYELGENTMKSPSWGAEEYFLKSIYDLKGGGFRKLSKILN